MGDFGDFQSRFSRNWLVKFPSKFLSMYFRSSSSHGYASLPPENFEFRTIKIQMKNYRNVKPMAIGTIYFWNSSTPKKDDWICPYFPILETKRCSIHWCWPWPQENSCFCTILVFGFFSPLECLYHIVVPCIIAESCRGLAPWVYVTRL